MPTLTIRFTGLMLFVNDPTTNEVDVVFPAAVTHGAGTAHGGEHPAHVPQLFVPLGNQLPDETSPKGHLIAPLLLADWASTQLVVNRSVSSGEVSSNWDPVSPGVPPKSWDSLRLVPRLRRLYPDGKPKAAHEIGHYCHRWQLRGGRLKAHEPSDPLAKNMWSWLSNTDATPVQRYVTDVVVYEFDFDQMASVRLLFKRREPGFPTFTLALNANDNIQCHVVCHPTATGPKRGFEIGHLGLLAEMALTNRIGREVLPFCPPSQCPDDPLCPSATMGFE